MSILNSLIARSLPLLPRGLLWRVARRYIAGVEVEQALEAVEALRREGLRATLDILGEDVSAEGPAAEACAAYRRLLERIAARDLPSGISIKLSQLGVRFSPDGARRRVEQVVERARELGRFVRIDMEDSSLTGVTLDIFRAVSPGRLNLGAVLQAYLRRSLGDLESLLPLRPDIRICKGIYIEPPEIALSDPDEIRASFLALLDGLLEGGGRAAIATHDPALVEAALERLGKLGPAGRRHEFQMLLGVGAPLRRRILEAGFRVRVYVPFGSNWYPYSLRRLRENPAIAGHVFRDLVRSLPGPRGA